MINSDYLDLSVGQRNRLPPRAYVKREVLSLNGSWDFQYFDSPLRVPPGLITSPQESRDWTPLEVPSCWQLAGWGQMHYTDLYYPFPVIPPQVPAQTPTGVYQHRFTLPQGPREEKTILRFHGVDSAFHVYLNGDFTGYSQGSRMMAEFPIDQQLVEGENTLVVVVYQFCTDSYLEDQDMWWLSGIFRDVEIERTPLLSLWDYRVRTPLDENYENARLDLEVTLDLPGGKDGKKNPSGRLQVRLDQELLGEIPWEDRGESPQMVLTAGFPVASPRLWTAETPHLYALELEVLDDQGERLDRIEDQIGFRQVEVKGEQLLLNGRQLFFRGVNRHDFNCDTGRTVTPGDMEKDVLLMKQHNINAVRTSHYPNLPYFYELCDRYGLYVIDEADLECHGLELTHHYAWLSEDRDWRESYLDRARRLVARDINRPSVLIWSLGNESSFGENFAAMAALCREKDPTRLIHYEGDRDCRVSDVFSTMYTNPQDLGAIGREGGKPHLLCEYAHAMGNGPGGLEEYREVLEKYPRLHGGFVWEWIDQGVRSVDDQGRSFFKYGGDYGEAPHDGNFNCDGLLFPDRSPSPGLLEYKKIIEPVNIRALDLEKGLFSLGNRYGFLGLEGCGLHWQVKNQGKTVQEGTLSLEGIPPQGDKTLTVPWKLPPREPAFLDMPPFLYLEVRLQEDCPWAPAGHLLADAHFPLPVPQVQKNFLGGEDGKSPGRVEETWDKLSVQGPCFKAVFDKVTGGLVSYDYQGENLLARGPRLKFWRAPTDNDRYQVKVWKEELFLHLMGESRQSFSWEEKAGGVEIVSRVLAGAPNQEWYFDCQYRYVVHPGGELSLRVQGEKRDPHGMMKSWLPRIGVEMKVSRELSQARWFGRGPGESYSDSCRSGRVDLHEMPVRGLYTPYVFPQENGNRSEVSWFCLEKEKTALAFRCPVPLNFHAQFYSPEQLEKAKHSQELKEEEHITVHVDSQLLGLGSNSCGPVQGPEHQIRLQNFDFEFFFGGRARD